MLNRKRIKEIVEMQDSLNNQTAGTKWKAKGYDWRLYAIMEAAEAIESLPYKHWKKNQEADLANVKVEVVDIFHFIISDALINYSKEDILGLIEDGMTTTYKGRFRNGASPKSLVVGFKTLINVIHNDPSEDIFESLWQAWQALEETPESFYKAYMVKNILNGFRQANGYKEGTYQKLWGFNGELVEDNVVAYHLAATIEVGEDFVSSLKGALKNKYKTVL